MCAQPYDTLAHVYEWLIPDDLLTPASSAAAFAPLLEPLEWSARILDCQQAADSSRSDLRQWDFASSRPMPAPA